MGSTVNDDRELVQTIVKTVLMKLYTCTRICSKVGLALPVFRLCPVKTVCLCDFSQARLVGEEESEVGGEDAVLDVTQHLLVLVWGQLGEDVVILLLQDDYRHVEVVVLHGRGGVDSRKGGANVNHELIVESSVVQIMT